MCRRALLLAGRPAHPIPAPMRRISRTTVGNQANINCYSLEPEREKWPHRDGALSTSGIQVRLSWLHPAGSRRCEPRLPQSLLAFIPCPWHPKMRRCWLWLGRYWWRFCWCGISSPTWSMFCVAWRVRWRSSRHSSMHLAASQWWCSFSSSIRRSGGRDFGYYKDGLGWRDPREAFCWDCGYPDWSRRQNESGNATVGSKRHLIFTWAKARFSANRFSMQLFPKDR